MIEDTISPARARRFYDRIGARYDWAEFYESEAKRLARQMLELEPGDKLLNIGIGTGKAHTEFTHAVEPGGMACGLDLSPVMARLANRRTGAPVVEADARFLPFGSSGFTAIYAAYVLDLMPAADIPRVLDHLFRVLAPGGRVLLLSLTEGEDFASRSLVAAWKFIYSFAPLACGGCRPLVLSEWVTAAGFVIMARETVVQWGVPSEIILASRSNGDEDEA
jgi:demethylmenaquinone methyltransferase/2-methoxy-6-polyprenyl-1,4-benzoquinol methylase